MNWKETTDSERNLKIYNEEIRDFIPQKIFDFHVHVFNEEILPKRNPGLELPGVHIKNYTISELKNDMKSIYPGKEFFAVVFGYPEYSYDSDINNKYVERNSDRKAIFPFRLVRPDEVPEKIEEEIKASNFFGIKPYLNYVTWKPPDDIEINDMIPESIMEVVNRYGLIVMLHIPRKARLADPVNQKQICDLALSFPDTKIVLAHTGRAYYLKNIVGSIERIKNLKNVYCDISMINNWEVLEYLFKHFDHKRIIYGTDIPISLCGGKSIEINDQYTYVTRYPWHLSISDDHKKLVFTSFIYEEIRAVKKAKSRLNLGMNFLEDIFYNNGMELIKSINRSFVNE